MSPLDFGDSNSGEKGAGRSRRRIGGMCFVGVLYTKYPGLLGCSQDATVGKGALPGADGLLSSAC